MIIIKSGGNALGIGHGIIRSRFPKSYKGVRINLSGSLGPQAQRAFSKLPHPQKTNPNKLDAAEFERGLRRAIRWEEFRTGFRLDGEATIPPALITKILSGEIFSPSSRYGAIYEREEVVDLSEARIWLRRFIYVMEHLLPAEEFDLINDPITFFARGPAAKLSLGLEGDPHFEHAAFPCFNLPEGEFRYIQPVLDNLVGLQFRVLDPQKGLLWKYAYDREFPERFSVYTYREEELREFEIFNRELLGEDERTTQREGIKNIKQICLALRGQSSPFATSIPLPIRFKIAGPARRIILDLGQGTTIGFYHLHLEPTKVYKVEAAVGTLPGSGQRTFVVKFTESDTGRTSSAHYFDLGQKEFRQISLGTLAAKRRIVIPEKFRPRIWDEEGDRGLVL